MKIEIVVTDKQKGTLRIPLSKKDIGDMFDFSFMLSKATWDCAELNKVDVGVNRILIKFQHLLHDVIHDGKMYTMDDDGNFTLEKKRMWLIKKPKWVK